MSEWIKVSERLPNERQGGYLVTDGNQVRLSPWSNYYGNLYAFLVDDGPDYFKITHWQPLPDPPTDFS